MNSVKLAILFYTLIKKWELNAKLCIINIEFIYCTSSPVLPCKERLYNVWLHSRNLCRPDSVHNLYAVGRTNSAPIPLTVSKATELEEVLTAGLQTKSLVYQYINFEFYTDFIDLITSKNTVGHTQTTNNCKTRL